jgi:hypothetical protein
VFLKFYNSTARNAINNLVNMVLRLKYLPSLEYNSLSSYFLVTNPRSLFDIWLLYQSEISATQSQTEADATLSRTKTALLRFTLPGWGLAVPKGSKMTALETEIALNYMKNISLEKFQDAYQTQQKVFYSQKVSSNSQRTYRAALRKLLEWCELMPWWSKSMSISDKRFSSKKQQQQSVVDARVTNRQYKNNNGEQIQPYRYGLGAVKGDVLPESLQEELRNFQQFRIDPNGLNSARVVKQSTVELDFKHIRLILGWLHRFRDVPIEEMSLKQMVKIPSEWNPRWGLDILQSEDAAVETTKIADAYIAWLKADIHAIKPEDRGRGIESSYTEISVLETFLVVAKFLYHPFTEVYEPVPVIDRLKDRINKVIQSKSNKHTLVSNDEPKLLDWTEYLTSVEKLRDECSCPRQMVIHFGETELCFNNWSIDTVAKNYQSFILAALFAYLPPQRQQIYRNLQVVDRNIVDEDNNCEKISEISGYLYKKADEWYICLLPDTYNTTRRNGEKSSFLIPNIYYSDKKCFYQYLSEWMEAYNYIDSDSNFKEIDGLRQVFKPQHDFVFVKNNGERYMHQSDFSRLLYIPYYRVSGQLIIPKSLKKIYLTYMRDSQQKLFTANNLTWVINYPLEKLYKYDVWANIDEINNWLKVTAIFAQSFYDDRTDNEDS